MIDQSSAQSEKTHFCKVLHQNKLSVLHGTCGTAERLLGGLLPQALPHSSWTAVQSKTIANCHKCSICDTALCVSTLSVTTSSLEYESLLLPA